MSSMPLIKLDKVSFSYEGAIQPAVSSVSLDIDEGEYVAIVGANGSGKSTLLRLLNGMRVPSSGRVSVAGLDAGEAGNARAIRSSISLVFQSPIDQIVSTVVAEDVAFGPENLGLSRQEIGRRVDAALEAVGLVEERCRPSHFLSAGQQQRLAVAGALAMGPRCIAFDEATSMLDPPARAAVLALMDRLSASGVAILHVTHDMTEAARARRLVALEEGRVVYDGEPDGLLAAPPAELAMPAQLVPPASVRLARDLGLRPRAAETAVEIARRIAAMGRFSARTPKLAAGAVVGVSEEAAFELSDVGYTYLRGTSNEKPAVHGISMALPRGSVVALVGRTGSGKSTILQLLDGLAFPSRGIARAFGEDTAGRKLDIRALRTRAPLSVQRPESALFELYAGDDVAYGPRNLGLKGKALVERVRRAMDRVALPFDEFRDRRSRALSGGEKRKLALAGVLALEPEAFLLDEPTSALDPAMKRAILDLVFDLARSGATIVMATHSMDEAAAADLVGVVVDGRLAALGPPADIFYDRYESAWGIGRPFACEVATELSRLGLRLGARPLDVDALADVILGRSELETAALDARVSGGAG